MILLLLTRYTYKGAGNVVKFSPALMIILLLPSLNTLPLISRLPQGVTVNVVIMILSQKYCVAPINVSEYVPLEV
ncbi:hypothetical protein D3C80_1514440 [compost metagenome]